MVILEGGLEGLEEEFGKSSFVWRGVGKDVEQAASWIGILIDV